MMVRLATSNALLLLHVLEMCIYPVLLCTVLLTFSVCISLFTPGVGGIDKYSTSVFLGKILRYNYIPTIGVADLQAPLNNMLQTS